MKKTLIQIYEIQSPKEAEIVISTGIDHVGSVLLSDANYGSLKETISFVKEKGAKSSLIPLFNDTDAVCQALLDLKPDIVHFCSTFTDIKDKDAHIKKGISLQKSVKKYFPEISIMRSIEIAGPGFGHIIPSLDTAKAFQPFSDFFLTDTWPGTGSESDKTDPVPGFVGITGQICDWDIAAKLVSQSSIPVILAGGISPENVFFAILKTKPYGVDSCTLTNAKDDKGKTIRFKKDKNLVKAMVNESRRADILLYGEK